MSHRDTRPKADRRPIGADRRPLDHEVEAGPDAPPIAMASIALAKPGARTFNEVMAELARGDKERTE